MKKRNFLPNLSPVFIILALLISNALSAQQSLVSGRVVNQDNAPLSGATVSIRGTKLATRTSENGTFSFNNVPLKKIVLTVSYVGYQAKDVTFRAGEETQVSLVESTLDGDEVIVTGVFDKRKKLEASVAITTISARQIARVVPASAADLLKNVPGVYINSSLGEIRNTVYSRGVSVGSNDGASGYYYVSMQEDGLPVTNATYGNYGPDYFLRADATIGRVEAVRGGTASILGANAPGGIFNYVSKEGGAKTAGEIRTKYGLEGNGKNDFFRTDFNLGGPLGNNWYYNVGGFYRQAQGARYPGYAINNGGQFKANIVKKYSTGSLKIYGKYQNDKNGWFEFTPTVGFSDPKPATGFDENSSVLSPAIKQHFPINQTGRTGTYNNADLIHSVDKSAGLNWEQRFGDGWTFTNAMRYSDKSATWNTNAVVYPLDMRNLISYAILGQLGRPGTYSFRGLNSGRGLLSVKSFSGFDFNVTANSLPGNAVAPNSLFFEPMIFQTNNVKEFLDQFAISKKINKMSFTAGGYYGNSKVDRLGGTAGLGLATIQDRPELVSITLTNPDSSISQLTNSNGIMGTGGGLSLNNAKQNQFALFFGHNWQVTDALNFDWGVRYEKMHVKGQNSPGVTTTSDKGGLDGNLLTQYDNVIGTTPVTYLFDKTVSTVSYSAGVNYKLNNHFSLYGRYSEGNKAPDLDLYITANTEFTSKYLNPLAQKVRQFEMGLKTKTDRLNLFVTPFYSILSNVASTQTFSNADQTFYSPSLLYNKYRTVGLEVEADYSITKYFHVRGVVTLQKSKALDYNVWLAKGLGAADDSVATFSGNETDNIARSIINITPAYTRDKFFAQLTCSYMGKRQANVANAFLLPSFSQVSLSTGYDVSKNFQLSFNINNLFNKYGVMSWSRPGSFIEALDRQGFTKEMYEAAVKNNTPYSTVAISARSYYLTATFKF